MRYWTKSQDDDLRQMASDNFSAGRIAKRMGGVTRSAVCGRASRIGVIINGIGEGRLRSAPFRPKFKGTATKIPQVAVGSLDLTFAELESGQCKYATTADAPFLFCGAPSFNDGPWCQHHHGICHEAPKKRWVR